MARFRKVEQRLWADERFRSLTPPTPNARDLWIALLIGECTTLIPGVVLATPIRLFDSLGWGAPELRGACDSALSEVLMKMPVQADTSSGLLWLPNGPKYNKPQNPSVIASWRETWALIPECNLKRIVANGLFKYAKTWGHSYLTIMSGLTSTPHPETPRDQEQEAGAGAGAGSPPTPSESEAAGQLRFDTAPANGNGARLTVTDALRAMAEASGGRFHATNPGGAAVHVQALITAHPDVAAWRLIGEWFAAGGEGYRDHLDSRALTAANFDAWIYYSREWAAGGRGPVGKQKPTRRDTRMPVRTDR